MNTCLQSIPAAEDDISSNEHPILPNRNIIGSFGELRPPKMDVHRTHEPGGANLPVCPTGFPVHGEGSPVVPLSAREIQPLTDRTRRLEASREAATECLPDLRKQLHAFLRVANGEMKTRHLYLLRQAVHDLFHRAETAGIAPARRLSLAVEGLIQEIGAAPEKIGFSTTRTLARSLDLLARLIAHANVADGNEVENIHVLAVDDEAISRRAIVNTLTRANLDCVSVGDPALALPMLAAQQFDLVVVDIAMPGMDGYELCRRLRAMPAHARVPVFFVTGLTDFQSRVQSLRSGGNDFIAKPFLSQELLVKAVISIFEWRLGLAPVPESVPEANMAGASAAGMLPSRKGTGVRITL